MKLKGGIYWFHLVRLSIRKSFCGEIHFRSVSSTILARSIPYLHILSSNFRRYVTCIFFKQQNWTFVNFSKFWLCIVSTWGPIWINSMGNHRQHRYPQNTGILVVLVEYVHSQLWLFIVYQLIKWKFTGQRTWNLGMFHPPNTLNMLVFMIV